MYQESPVLPRGSIPAKIYGYEKGHPSKILRSRYRMRLRRKISRWIDHACDACGNLRCLPSFLHRHAKTGGHPRPSREIQGACGKGHQKAGYKESLTKSDSKTKLFSSFAPIYNLDCSPGHLGETIVDGVKSSNCQRRTILSRINEAQDDRG